MLSRTSLALSLVSEPTTADIDIASRSRAGCLVGSLSKDYDDSSENVAKKNEFAFFQT